MPNDATKRDRLIARLSNEPEPQIVEIEAFFDGNDDLGSLGCNLIEPPGIEAFRSALSRIAARPDVKGVYAQIFELDPGEDCWPFTDTILIVGDISSEEAARELASLEPDEVRKGEEFGLPDEYTKRLGGPIVVAWWD